MRFRQQVRGVGAITAVVMAAGAVCFCAGVAAAGVLSPEEVTWRQEALQRAEALADAPDLRISRYDTRAAYIEFDFEVVRTPSEQKAVLAVAVPTGEYTTGSVSQYRASSPVLTAVTAAPVTFEQLGYVRGHKLGRVTFVIATAPDGEPVTSGTVRLQFAAAKTGSQPNRAWMERESTGPIRAALERLVVNPGDLSKLMVASPADIPGAAKPAWNPVSSSSPFRLRVPIDRTGLYQVTGQDLASSGVDLLNLRPDDLRLLLEGESQPLHFLPASGKSATAVSPLDRWIFHALANPSIYATTNTYWLVNDPTSPATAMQKAVQPAPAVAVERAQVFPAIQKVEQDNPPVLTRNDQFLTILGFRWAWWTWTDGRGAVPEPIPLSQPGQFNFDLPGLYVSGGNVKASAFFYPHSWPTGQKAITVRIRINDAPPVDMQIENTNDEQKDFEVLASSLRESGNTAVLELVDAATSPTVGGRRQYIELCFDRLEINYQKLYKAGPSGLEFGSPAVSPADAATSIAQVHRAVEYVVSGISPAAQTVVVDVTDSITKFLQHEHAADTVRMRVVESTPRKYLLSDVGNVEHAPLEHFTPGTDLHNAEIAADYVIVCHPFFTQTIQTFAQRKSAEGHKVQVVDIRDVYDQFGAGQSTPHALRSFIRYITAAWKGSAHAPAATCVLFVGDSSSAYRDEFRNGVFNYVPSMTVGESGDRFASDQWFATSFGDDLLADNLLGRISVNNVHDLSTMLKKHADYQDHPGDGPWRNTLTYVADHSDFEQSVETIMNQTVPARFFLQRIFMSEEPWIDNYYFPLEVAEAKKSKVSPKTTAKIRDMFNAGAAMVTYFGHGSPNVWSNERIWFGGDSENSDNRMLTNRDKLSFIVNMTCNSGAIDYPMPRWNVCISEDFMRIPNGGAIACYVPSGPGITSQHERFTLQLNRALLEERVVPLGASLALANWRYLLMGNPPDLARMFILLGDPDLELQIAEPLKETFNPAEMKSGYVQHVCSTAYAFSASPVTTVTEPLMVQTTATSHSAMIAVLPVSADRPRSSAIPVGEAPVISLLRSRHEPAGTVPPGAQVKFAFTLQNQGTTPARRMHLELSDGKTVLGKSAEFELLPLQEKIVPCTITAADGIARLTIRGYADGTVVPVKTADPVVLVSAVPNDQPSRALLIDPESLETRYASAPQGYNATVSFRAYNASEQVISSAVASLELDTAGAVTTVPVSAVAASAAAYVSMSVPLQTTASSQQLSVKLSSGTLEFQQPRPLQVRLSPEDVPDLMIVPDGVRVSSQHPSDGETVFFNVTVANAGRTVAEGVRVDAFAGVSTSETERLESRVTGPVEPFAIEPGTTRTVALRWDPFHNAGPQHVEFRITTSTGGDRDPANNTASMDLKVRTKARVRPVNIAILEPSTEDRQKGQMRVVATLRNDGETDAQGIRVVFYPTPKRVQKDAMGDAIIEVLPAGTSRDAVLVYKLKPGEEKFKFVPSCETMLKGSLQRTPLTPES
ncbi:MAG: C25 family cysteine peptidase [Candidatus Sumerlaeaceae bacterium]